MQKTIKALKAVCEWAVASGHESAVGYNEILQRVDWDNRRKTVKPKTNAVVKKYFKQAVELAGDNPLGDLGRAALAEADTLEWFTMYHSYDDDERVAGLHANYTIVRLAGPTGDWYADDLTTALSLQGPDTWYPAHVHRQSEVYGVVGGEAQWQRGAEPWVTRPSGDIIYHPSGMRHATQTGDQPLLSFASWIDHIHTPSIFVWD